MSRGRRILSFHPAGRHPVFRVVAPQLAALQSRKNAALILGVSEDTIDRMLRAGRLLGYRVGGTVRIDVSAIVASEPWAS